MSNESGSPFGTPSQSSQAVASGVGQTANVGRSTSITGGAAKVFKEFKWGLLTLFLLMVVVIGLVYDGGRKKKVADDKPIKSADATPQINIDGGTDAGQPPASPSSTNNTSPAPSTNNNSQTNGPRPGVPVVETYQPPASPAPVIPPSLPGDNRQASSATPDKPSNPAVSEQTYIVKPGDTLTRIASTMLPGKGSIKAILDANKDVLANANRLRPGMTLKIPAAMPVAQESHVVEAAPGTHNHAKQGNATGDGVNEYTVQNGDTLEHIARKLFNDGRKWRDLYEWNREQLTDPSRLRLGQVLKVKQVKTAATPAATPGPAAAGAAAKETAPTTLEEHKNVKAGNKSVADTVVKLENASKIPEVEVLNRSLPTTP